MKKTFIQRAFKSASKDMNPDIKKLRKIYPNNRWIDWSNGWSNRSNQVDKWVVGMDRLNTIETRNLNNELGLTTATGINKWYKYHIT